MTPESDPQRLADSSSPGDSLLRDALTQARSDVSPEDALSRILSRLPPGPPGIGGGGGQSAASHLAAGAATSMLPGVLTGALAGVVVSISLWITGIGAPPSSPLPTSAMPGEGRTFTEPEGRAQERQSPGRIGTGDSHAPPNRPSPRSGASPTDSTPPAAAPAQGDTAIPAQGEPPSAGESASSGAPTEGEAESEAALLARAQGLVGPNPSGALALTEQHRSRFPKGTLGQERDVIAITALVAMGRTADARARAEAMLAHDPSSAHRRRLARIVPGLSTGGRA